MTAAVLSIEMLFAWRRVAVQMANCADVVCDGYAEVGRLRAAFVAFALGFAAAFFWFQRRQRRLVA